MWTGVLSRKATLGGASSSASFVLLAGLERCLVERIHMWPFAQASGAVIGQWLNEMCERGRILGITGELLADWDSGY